MQCSSFAMMSCLNWNDEPGISLLDCTVRVDPDKSNLLWYIFFSNMVYIMHEINRDWLIRIANDRIAKTHHGLWGRMGLSPPFNSSQMNRNRVMTRDYPSQQDCAVALNLDVSVQVTHIQRWSVRGGVYNNLNRCSTKALRGLTVIYLNMVQVLLNGSNIL